jgi:hypothetical protein
MKQPLAVALRVLAKGLFDTVARLLHSALNTPDTEHDVANKVNIGRFQAFYSMLIWTEVSP